LISAALTSLTVFAQQAFFAHGFFAGAAFAAGVAFFVAIFNSLKNIKKTGHKISQNKERLRHNIFLILLQQKS
jgi:hypothetical protein